MKSAGVNTRGVGIFIVCFVTFGGVMFTAMWLTLGTFMRQVHPHETTVSVVGTNGDTEMDQPLQPSPGHPTLDWQDLSAMKAAQIKGLRTYAAIPNDPAHVKIPIDRAMQLLIESKSLAIPPNPEAVPSTQPYIDTTQPAPTENRT